MGGGRKPKAEKGVILGMNGARQAVPAASPAVDLVVTAGLLVPPTDLVPEAQVYWRLCAEHAIGERTLTPATASGFRELCDQWAFQQKLHARIQLLGADTKEADPYLKTYIKLAQRLDSSLARFKLTAFGKPAVSEKPKAAANPWAQVVGK